MNILVTGGAGFICSHIVDRLIGEGHRVAVVDNLSTGNRAFLHPQALFWHMDILDTHLTELFAAFQPEIVIHHAAQIDVQTSLQRPLWDAQVNILGSLSLFELCRKHGVRKIVYASSAAVYGMSEQLLLSEAHSVQPLSFYGISKHTPEHYLEAFSSLYGLDYTILRYANVYGIRQDAKSEGGVVSIFLARLLRGQPPVIYGDGRNTRDFIYVKDVVSANMAALERGSRGIYNVGCGQPVSILSLLRTMCELTGKPYNPVHEPARPGDIIHCCLDNRAAGRDLLWEPAYTLDDGLLETWGHYTSSGGKQTSPDSGTQND
ncbi:NAD-dependent epimerase/dehydratase family protein [Paenibacillus sp. y28]|uniref:NAD-dependent epimerase/dehydratase family protein n=1 Tax=Paenibacillus sp. y28 TaxID=3129110 RepID=UPI0030177195